VHFISGSAHKFHGPKGAGLLYINENVRIHPSIHGGGQERNMRAGTENVYGIVGFAKALEIATQDLEKDKVYIQGIKTYMISELKKRIPAVSFNGDPEGYSNYTVLNLSIPKSEKSEMLLMNLDMAGICASGGSACTSGAQQGSHVIRAMNPDPNRIPLRFSFSKYNHLKEVDIVIDRLLAFI
jgi:cysteine desulfurase